MFDVLTCYNALSGVNAELGVTEDDMVLILQMHIYAHMTSALHMFSRHCLIDKA